MEEVHETHRSKGAVSEPVSLQITPRNRRRIHNTPQNTEALSDAGAGHLIGSRSHYRIGKCLDFRISALNQRYPVCS